MNSLNLITFFALATQAYAVLTWTDGKGTEKEYLTDTVKRKYLDAVAHCKSLGGRLPIIKSQQDNDALHDFIKSRPFVYTFTWLGATLKENNKNGKMDKYFQWDDESLIDSNSYTNWHVNPPSYLMPNNWRLTMRFT